MRAIQEKYRFLLKVVTQGHRKLPQGNVGARTEGSSSVKYVKGTGGVR